MSASSKRIADGLSVVQNAFQEDDTRNTSYHGGHIQCRDLWILRGVLSQGMNLQAFIISMQFFSFTVIVGSLSFMEFEFLITSRK